MLSSFLPKEVHRRALKMHEEETPPWGYAERFKCTVARRLPCFYNEKAEIFVVEEAQSQASRRKSCETFASRPMSPSLRIGRMRAATVSRLIDVHGIRRCSDRRNDAGLSVLRFARQIGRGYILGMLLNCAIEQDVIREDTLSDCELDRPSLFTESTARFRLQRTKFWTLVAKSKSRSPRDGE